VLRQAYRPGVALDMLHRHGGVSTSGLNGSVRKMSTFSTLAGTHCAYPERDGQAELA